MEAIDILLIPLFVLLTFALVVAGRCHFGDINSVQIPESSDTGRGLGKQRLDWAEHFAPAKAENVKIEVDWYMSLTSIRLATPEKKVEIRRYLTQVASNSQHELRHTPLTRELVGAEVQLILDDGKKR